MRRKNGFIKTGFKRWRQGHILARAQQFCPSPSYFSESHPPMRILFLFIPTPLRLLQSKTHILEGNCFPLLASRPSISMSRFDGMTRIPLGRTQLSDFNDFTYR